MEPIRISVTLSPHCPKGKPRGYYVLAQRIFPRGAPIMVKQQFVGFTDCMIVTAAHPPSAGTPLAMAVTYPVLDKPVTWLAVTALYPMNLGFRMYIPGTILIPDSAEAPKIMTTGIVHKFGEVFYVEIPRVTGDILLRRKRLTYD